MKAMTILFNFGVFFLVGCTAMQIPSTATAMIEPTGTKIVQRATLETPQPTVTATVTPQGTAISNSQDERSTAPCLFLMEAETLPSGQLHLVFASECVSELDATPKKLWLWVENQGPATAFPLPQDAVDPYLSQDHGEILFRRDVDEQVKEIWVIDSDGQNERKLATVSLAEVEARYPGVFRIALEYGWVGDSHRMVYRVQPQFDLEAGAYDTLVLVDTDTGESRSLTPPGEVNAVANAPTGGQIAATTPDELRLIDATSGEVQFTLPLSTGMTSPGLLQYSPGGRYLVVFASEGMAIVDAAAGTYQVLPIDFILWGAGDSPLAKPVVHWATEGTFLMAALHSEIRELFEGNIDIWQVDAAEADASLIQRLTGFYPSVKISLNMEPHHLFYQKVHPENIVLRELYLLDLASGAQRLYVEGEIDAAVWSPDSGQFLFARSDRVENHENPIYRYYLGDVDQEPRLVGEITGFLRWAGQGRFLAIQRTPEGIDELRLYTLEGEGGQPGFEVIHQE